MPSFASVTLIGNLGRDCESKYLPDGTAVTKFSLATSRKRKDGEVTTWWNAVIFGKRGEALAQWLHKGDPVLIQGEPSLRAYTAKDGSERQSLEVDVREWAFVGSKGERQTPDKYEQQLANRPKADFQAPPSADFSDDIPW
jgi:single-strand DNA-binding protein